MVIIYNLEIRKILKMVPPVIIPKNESLKTLFDLENEKYLSNPKPYLKIFDKNNNVDLKNKISDLDQNKFSNDNLDDDKIDNRLNVNNYETIKKDPNNSNKEIHI